jgi:hypothetical protein
MMELRVENVIMNVDSINAWAIKDIGYIYCDLFNHLSEISNSSVRNEIIEKWLTYLITCVQKLGKYSGVIYSHFHAEKLWLETRVNRVVIEITSVYARDFKNITLFLGVLLDGILSIENAIERHKFIVKTMADTLSYFEPAKMNLFVNHSNRSMKKIAQ